MLALRTVLEQIGPGTIGVHLVAMPVVLDDPGRLPVEAHNAAVRWIEAVCRKPLGHGPLCMCCPVGFDHEAGPPAALVVFVSFDGRGYVLGLCGVCAPGMTVDRVVEFGQRRGELRSVRPSLPDCAAFLWMAIPRPGRGI
jgi:hypothetical protein